MLKSFLMSRRAPSLRAKMMNEAADSTKIPIHKGFYIQIKSGKAVDPTGRQQESIREEEIWMRENRNHANFQSVEPSLLLRQEEVQDSEATYRDRSRDAEFDKGFTKIARISV